MANGLGGIVRLEAAVEGGDEDVAAALAADLLSRGAEPTDLTDALARAMHRLGQRFHRLEVFVPDLLVAADAFEAAMRVVQPALKRTPHDAKGVVVLGVVEGDIHTLGKDLVRVMLAADGFAVHDLGRNVKVADFIDAAQRTQAHIIAMSSLMTTTMGAMADVVAELSTRGRRAQHQVLVGGAPVTQQFADEIGADGYGEDASDAVAVANRLVARARTSGAPKP